MAREIKHVSCCKTNDATYFHNPKYFAEVSYPRMEIIRSIYLKLYYVGRLVQFLHLRISDAFEIYKRVCLYKNIERTEKESQGILGYLKYIYDLGISLLEN